MANWNKTPVNTLELHYIFMKQLWAFGDGLGQEKIGGIGTVSKRNVKTSKHGRFTQVNYGELLKKMTQMTQKLYKQHTNNLKSRGQSVLTLISTSH